MRAFVAMSFKKTFTPVFQVIKNVCDAHRASPFRADQLKVADEGNVFDEILREISLCDFMIADASHEVDPALCNLDVIYQLGIARHAKKPTIILTQNPDNLPFDLKQQRTLKYTLQQKELAFMEGRLHELMGSICDRVKKTSKIHAAPPIPAKGGTRQLPKEGRNWRRKKAIQMPKGRNARGPYKDGANDHRRRAFYDESSSQWDMFESDMSALAKKLSPSWVHGASEIGWVHHHLRNFANEGRFLEHLHIVAQGTNSGGGGFKIGDEIVDGYWEAYRFGAMIANVLCVPGTITLWASGSGQDNGTLGSTILGLAMGSGCKVAGLTCNLVLNKKNEARWRAAQDEGAWQRGSQQARLWNVAYPNGAFERGNEMSPLEGDRAIPFGPVDISGFRENEAEEDA